MKQKSILTAAVLTVIVLIFTACSKQQGEYRYEETLFKMGTAMTIKAYGEGAQEAVKSAFNRIDEIEQLTNLNTDTSDLNKINNGAGMNYVNVHPDLIKIIKKAIEYSKISNGAFDITIGPIVKLWNIGTKDAKIPSREEIMDKLSLVGYEKVKINETNNSVMLEKQGMILDLGGIAKGYAADEAARVIKDMGIEKAVINLGGSSVCVIGVKEDNTLWKIGIQHPRKENGAGYLGIIHESDKSVSTTGDYERFFEKNGKRYHHVMDPFTGYPAESGIMSATIITDSSMDADALSTIAFVLGPKRGLELIESIPGLESVIATSDRRIVSSAGMKGKIESISEDFKYDAQGR